MYKIAVDLGYGFVKGLNEEGEIILFPSVVGTAHSRELKNLFGPSSGERLRNLHVHIREGDLEGEYFVGELAQQESRAKSYAFAANKIWHENSIVALATAAALLAGGKEEILLVTGLPFQFYKSQRCQFENFLKMFDAEVIFKGEQEVPFRVRFARAAVFPQAAGAVYQAVAEHPELKEYPGSTIAVVDIGYKTTDYIAVRIGIPLQTLEQLSGTIELGTSYLHRAFAERFFQKTGSQVDIAAAAHYVHSGGRFYYDGQEYDLGEFLASARREMAKIIKDELIACWGDSYRQFRALFLAGGGALELAEYFQREFPMALVVRESQLANVRGFLFYAGLLERKIKSGIK